MSTKLSVEAFKGVDLLARDDLYDLAQLILRLQRAADKLQSQGCRVTTRMSARGFAHALASLARVPTGSAVALLQAHGIALEALVVTPEEAAAAAEATAAP